MAREKKRPPPPEEEGPTTYRSNGMADHPNWIPMRPALIETGEGCWEERKLEDAQKSGDKRRYQGEGTRKAAGGAQIRKGRRLRPQ